jgi:hypothetical protein
MTFRKRTARGKTLLQKGFPPGPSFRKLLNDCAVALSQRQDCLPAHKLEYNIIGVLCGGSGGRLSCKKETPGLPAEQEKQSNREKINV